MAPLSWVTLYIITIGVFLVFNWLNHVESLTIHPFKNGDGKDGSSSKEGSSLNWKW
uniref:ATP synthase F0 subunit 8 n=1 Tax=Cordax unidentatus TaxID=3021430 RepID=UPI0030FF395A|nr:ATP synthase F0 subunit 8 [Cordax unidentatus]